MGSNILPFSFEKEKVWINPKRKPGCEPKKVLGFPNRKRRGGNQEDPETEGG
jgi:hypothetical protein